MDLLSEEAEDACTAVSCWGLYCLAVSFNLQLKLDKNSIKVRTMGNVLNQHSQSLLWRMSAFWPAHVPGELVFWRVACTSAFGEVFDLCRRRSVPRSVLHATEYINSSVLCSSNTLALLHEDYITSRSLPGPWAAAVPENTFWWCL